MTTLSPTAHAPFLVWPVARREFYRAIAIALLPTLTWAIILYGWRVMGMFIGSTFAVFIAHTLLKQTTDRGKLLVFPHSLVTAWVMVALAQPTWPIWIVSLAAFLVPFALWLVGGPGRERAHIAILAVILLQLAVLPLFPSDTSTRPAILAKDRLVMGDIRDQSPITIYRWPRSPEIRGNDAAAVSRPAQVANETLDQLSHLLAPRSLWRDVGSGPQRLNPDTRRQAEALFDHALGQLPSMELFLFGVTPGRNGAVSIIALVFAGLFLAYRYILRPRSVAFFFITYVLASALMALWPAILSSTHLSPSAVWRIGSAFPAEVVTLLIYSILNSDAAFAAIIILALPGSEPLTPRGRQVFLIVAAILAAFLSRFQLHLPTASLALAALMPLTHRFDHYFAKRSWLNRIF